MNLCTSIFLVLLGILLIIVSAVSNDPWGDAFLIVSLWLLHAPFCGILENLREESEEIERRCKISAQAA